MQTFIKWAKANWFHCVLIAALMLAVPAGYFFGSGNKAAVDRQLQQTNQILAGTKFALEQSERSDQEAHAAEQRISTTILEIGAGQTGIDNADKQLNDELKNLSDLIKRF